MKSILRGRIVLAILLPLLLLSAFSAYAEEKEKTPRFEVLFSGGGSYATSQFVFSLGAGFSYYLRSNLVLSIDLGVAPYIPYLDFPEFVELEEGYHTTIVVNNQYRLFSSLSGEYSFDVSLRLRPFLTAGVGWCRDCTNFGLSAAKLTENETEWGYIKGVPFQLDDSITCSEKGECKYLKRDFPLLILGGGVRYSLGSKTFLKVMIRMLDPGGDSATYQLLIGWGFRF